jgi:hypothetical protein
MGPFRFLKEKKIINKTFFWLHLFLASCSSNHSTASSAEEFLKKLLLEEGGAYTLIGDKPVTDLLIFTGSENDISIHGLSEETLQSLEYVEDHTFENWLSWKKLAETLNPKRIIFAERPCLLDPLHTMYLIINVEGLKDVHEKHRSSFRNIVGIDYEFDQVLKEINNPNSIFWNRSFEDHYLAGLLHGYGEENSRHFQKVMNREITPRFSKDFEGEITTENFPLPVFALSENDPATEKYQKQREKIKKIYRKNNFLKVTLKLIEGL